MLYLTCQIYNPNGFLFNQIYDRPPSKFNRRIYQNLKAKNINPRRRAGSIDDKKPIKPAASDANSSNSVQI
ncbi:MAG: hypothetical protein ACFNUU_04745 [Campylobacter sp.]|uniref:hypothetical protein n=1 Tax=Campylobacter sp. TaxID=205 RepID=UPI0036103E7C